MKIQENFDEINEQNLQDLIDKEIPESKYLDYKRDLPNNSDKYKKEFLKDVSSFANAQGGQIIYGISEKSGKGIPDELIGLDITNPDDEILRLESLIKTGVEPRIPNVRIKKIDLSKSKYKYAIIIDISESLISPHRVTIKGHDKFYSRASNGVFPMDVSELKSAFNSSQDIDERIKNFVKERIAKLTNNKNPPVILRNNTKIVIHLIPINPFRSNLNFDLSKKIKNGNDLFFKLRPIFGGGWNHQYNSDGFLTYNSRKEESDSYLQLFRNGTIEAVDSDYINNGNLLEIFSESRIIEDVKRFLEAMNLLGADFPIMIFISLIGVKNYEIPSAPGEGRFLDVKIDKDNLLLDPVTAQNDLELEKLLKITFDVVWNACGYPQSKSYDKNGIWLNK